MVSWLSCLVASVMVMVPGLESVEAVSDTERSGWESTRVTTLGGTK